MSNEQIEGSRLASLRELTLLQNIFNAKQRNSSKDQRSLANWSKLQLEASLAVKRDAEIERLQSV